jgi:signal transduction histidine kinase
MAEPVVDWSAHQLAEFLAAVSSYTDEASVIRGAVERAAEAFEAELGAVVIDGRLAASVGYPPGRVPSGQLEELAERAPDRAHVPGLGECRILSVPLEEGRPGRFLLARRGDAGFTVEERNLLRGMGRVLWLTLSMLDRQALLERLSKIQRSISHRAPLQEVLDAITEGARELLGVEVVGLRLIDPDDPSYALTVSSSGVDKDILEDILRRPIKEGAGGRAIAEDRLVIVEDYEHEPGMVPGFAQAQLQIAMAAPVHEKGTPVGSLVVASYRPDRRFSPSEQQALLALAEHASLALTDAKTVEAMREAQRSKDMFLAMVSHELKTPLTVIMGALRTLEVHGDALTHDVRQEVLSAGWNRGKELERLINRLLQGARAELVPRVEDVEVSELVGESIRGFRHGRRVVVDVPAGVAVRVDRPAVLEVLGILLENAVSHSELDSEIRIIAELRRSEMTLTVANAGHLPEGVDPESLFRPFQRGDDATSPGVGLGLYIAARVAESIDGSVEVRADAGWVRFSLRIPVFEVGAGGAGPTGSPRDDSHAPAPSPPAR